MATNTYENINKGVELIKKKVKTLPEKPGVYRMISESGDVLYVGKAKDLSKRVPFYTHIEKLNMRLQKMVAETCAMEFIVTSSESEALLLECELIKKFAPKYNILLKDDKSFPYILLTKDNEWPQLIKHRGAQKIDGQYFGPFASATAVNTTLNILQKTFMLRSCSDSEFANRSRPCLMYQIKRCSAPCVNYISSTDYKKLSDSTSKFLSGDDNNLQQELAEEMEHASKNMEYEKAAQLRDRIRSLSQIQHRQDISLAELKDTDILAIHTQGGLCCVQLFFYRSGQNCGNAAFFPKQTEDNENEDILSAFIAQFYSDHPAPREIIISEKIEDAPLISELLSEKSGYNVEIKNVSRGRKKELLEQVKENAKQAIERRVAEYIGNKKNLEEMAIFFGLSKAPERIEIYDNSHIQGAHAIGAMVVAGEDGFIKRAYRKFNIKNEAIFGDDFAMMREVIRRRFKGSNKNENTPDVLLIDGGKGQLSAVHSILKELGIADINVIAVSKGPDRNAGKEKFHTIEQSDISLPERSALLFYLQRLRDEAHRFAIGTHRKKRTADNLRSSLDVITGVGAKRKKALLNHFGSVEGIKNAKIPELLRADGINYSLAEKIYNFFHQ